MPEEKNIFNYGVNRMSAGLAIKIVNGELDGIINSQAAGQIEKSRKAVENIVSNEKVVYGINTGFGSLCTTKISPEDTKKLQYNILRSHSAGVGEKIKREISKLMLILKVHALSFGYSGIRRETLDRIIWHINNDVIPVVPNQGSVGASGDLVPLSHLFLPLIGLGEVFYGEKIVETETMFKKEGLKPLELGPKEGLALINGTQFIVANAIYGIDRFYNCLDNADIIGSMTLEALFGSVKPFVPELHELRPYTGTSYVAHRLINLLFDSEMVKSHARCGRVQDPYSLRCMPQVHGASRNAWYHLKEIMEIEINSVTDNPIILDEDNSVSGGNFHGQPIALPLDYATFAASELGNISDRRTYLLLEGKTELPTLLMKDTGVNSGFMIPQYTSAALVSENKTLCFPASADSIPTSLGQEDHVSMGSISARKLNRVLDNLENILAVELVCAAQAFDFRRPLKSSRIIEACHNHIRENIDHACEDRIFSNDIAVARDIIESKKLVEISEKEAKKEKRDLTGEYKKLSEY
ncbi:MAG: histidine ammonia-lyase [Acidobacteriota bacterium]